MSDVAVIFLIAGALILLSGILGGLIGYNLGEKQREPGESSVPALCRTLEKLVENTTSQSRRSMDMVSLYQHQQLDRVNAEYVAEAASNGVGIPANGYIEEPPPVDDMPIEIP